LGSNGPFSSSEYDSDQETKAENDEGKTRDNPVNIIISNGAGIGDLSDLTPLPRLSVIQDGKDLVSEKQFFRIRPLMLLAIIGFFE